MSQLVKMSPPKVVIFKDKLLPAFANTKWEHNQCDLLPPPPGKDDHRVVTVPAISTSVCLDYLGRCNVTTQKTGRE